MRRILVALAALLPLAASASVATLDTIGGNLVRNGGFEDYTQASGTWKIHGSEHEWTPGTAGVEIRDNVVGTAFEGDNFAELDTTRNSTIYQDISTIAGSRYLLSFSYSNRTGVAVGSNGLSWSFDGLTGDAPALAYNNSGNNIWSRYAVIVTAADAMTRLSLSALGTSDSLGSSLDDVSLLMEAPSGTNTNASVNLVPTSPVPEPTTPALMLAGLGVLAALRRKAAKKA